MDSSPLVKGASNWYVNASRLKIRGAFIVHKFGEGDEIPTGSYTTVWDGNTPDVVPRIPLLTFQTGAVIDSVVCANTGDTNRLLEVQGLDALGDLVVQEVRTNGQTVVPLQVALRRVFRARNLSDEGNDFAGNCYVFGSASAVVGGIPSDSTLVGAIVRNSHGQTQMSTYTVPRGHTMYASHGWANISKGGGSTAVSIELKILTRRWDRVWRDLHKTQMLSSGSSASVRPYALPIRVEGLHDLVYHVQPSTSGLSAAAGFHAVIIREDYGNSNPPKHVDEFGTVTYLYTK